MNPGGSVKDRIGRSIIEEAEKRGQLKPGAIIVEATSGNTGQGLAMVAAAKGYRCIFVMPDKVSEEKRAILRAFGAEVIITPSGLEPHDPRTYINTAKKILAETPNTYAANQFYNPDNPSAHYATTGPEIWSQMGEELDVFVAGAGTGGTMTGTGRYLHEKKPAIKNVLADPEGSILFDLFHHGRIVSASKPYKVEGVGEDVLPANVQLHHMDDVLSISDRESFRLTRELMAKEGICVGPSGGMALAAAFQFSQKLAQPSNILVLFPDSGKAYLSKVFNDTWMKESGLL
jgi:cystathionine beta-synthase